MPTPEEEKRLAAKEVISVLHDISTLLNTQLDRTSLSLCVSMIENGVNPEALAHVIKELRAQNPAAADDQAVSSSAQQTKADR